MLTIGIIREGKLPPDRRTPLTPEQCTEVMQKFHNIKILVQPSSHRVFNDNAYSIAGIQLSEDLSDCDVMLGIKEVPVKQLLTGKTYLFFSHTIKKQPHNSKLLQTILSKGIRLIDYECLTDASGFRIIGFGRFAGIAGTYNGLRLFGIRQSLFNLKPVEQYSDVSDVVKQLKSILIPTVKFVITGGGRVANGAVELLDKVGIQSVSNDDFLSEDFDYPVFTQALPEYYCRHKSGRQTDLNYFIAHPDEYESDFMKYARKADIYLACHFWDPRSPVLLSHDNLRDTAFKARVIADISCDVDGPIACTIRSSTIEEPFYGYDPLTKQETDFMKPNAVAVMAVDNLPCSLPKDASEYFGKELIEKVLPQLINGDEGGMIERATIAINGVLLERFSYLKDYAAI